MNGPYPGHSHAERTLTTPEHDTLRTTDVIFRPALDTAGYVTEFDIEARSLVAAARDGDLEAEIPYCPGWRLRDLITHVGLIYRWVGRVVGDACAEPPSLHSPELQDPDPADDAGVLERLETARASAVGALSAAPAGLDCWTTWLSPAPLTFWARRMLHETLIHRVDARNADHPQHLCRGEDLDTLLADDGIDEMVCGFAVRYAKRLRTPAPATLSLTATDTGHSWWVALSAGAPQFGRGPAPSRPDTSVRGRSGELLLFLWNRRDTGGLAVDGRAEVLDTWTREAHL